MTDEPSPRGTRGITVPTLDELERIGRWPGDVDAALGEAIASGVVTREAVGCALEGAVQRLAILEAVLTDADAAGRPGADDEPDLMLRFAAEFKALADRRHVAVILELTPLQAWALLSTVQLALRHPLNIGAISRIARDLAETLERAVATTPALAEVARRGWHRLYDQKADG